MADLKVNIIATDKASPSINKAAQALQNIASQAGVLSGSMGRLASQLGGLMGVGGMAGMATAAVALAANLEDIKHEFADWVTGMGDASEGLGELDSKTQAYVETLKKLRNQLELVGKAGVARTAAELGQRQREVTDLDARLQARQQDIARLEALRAEQAKGFAIPGVTKFTPGLNATEESLKRAKEDAAGLAKQLGEAQTQLSIAAATLTHEQAEEGTKRIEEQNKAFEKQRQEIERIDQMLEKMWGQGMQGEPPPVPMPIYPEQIIDKEKIKAAQQDLIEEGEDVRWEAFARGHRKRQNLLDKEAEYGKSRIEDEARRMDAVRDRAMAENQRQWERMYDQIRDGAGEIFDAMLTKGESVFTSLGKFAQGVLQTMLRNVFQNAVGGLLTSGGKAGGGIMGSFLGFGGAAAGGAMARGAAATGGLAQSGGITYAAGAAAGGGKGIGGFFGKLFGMGGSGAAGAAGLGGSLAMGAATAGISMAVGLGLSFVGGLFDRGAKKRAEEEARRKAAIEAQSIHCA